MPYLRFFTDKNFDRFPVIDKCSNDSRLCFQILHPHSEVSCTVKHSRSAILLTWMIRTLDGDRKISSDLTITNETHTHFTSRVTISDPSVFSEILTFLVCRADSPLGLLRKNESLALIQRSEETPTYVKPKQVLAAKDSRVQLDCNGSNISHLVWQVNQSSEIVVKTLLYAVFVEENLTHINDEYFSLEQTSLVVDEIRVRDKGTYRCISGNGIKDDVTVYDVLVFVYPDPAYLLIDGCDQQQYCVLEVQSQGSLTCTVNGIYPQVNLDIAKVFEQSSNALNFYDKSLTARENGDTFDVILTSKYNYDGDVRSRVTVNCKVVGTKIDVLHLSTNFELLFNNAGAESTTDENLSSDGRSYWIIAVVLTVVLVLLVLCGILIYKGRHINGLKILLEVILIQPFRENGYCHSLANPRTQIPEKSATVIKTLGTGNVQENMGPMSHPLHSSDRSEFFFYNGSSACTRKCIIPQ
ncbi:hypothetical protein HOLleu_02296 [Holothuria leucospilota]|uniref:Immunoglobulin domain-containing protein n=1 Tax=Holothuria leucospilota TaxID=206669 RepID=A0A9Q1CPF8_HOLLE|nr:hypothetical protein HOLleu_02296 [Holothuria leucospilota]